MIQRYVMRIKLIVVGCGHIGKEPHGSSDTNNALHVMHNHKWRRVCSVNSVLRVSLRFGVSHAKQMVSHSPKNVQRSHLLVPQVVQNLLPGLQRRSQRGPADRRMKWSIFRRTEVGVQVSPALALRDSDTECREHDQSLYHPRG